MITDKATLIRNIKRDIPDNTVGAISPRDIRQSFIDVVDSIHLLTGQHPLLSKNLYTIEDRTTVVGLENFIHLSVEDSLTKDNTAVGFKALNASYRGIDNTAIGSHAISCLINGESNVGVGFHSLAGNINGSANLGVGNYTLNGNRQGNFNIAIGHGAGYYAGRDSSYQFFLGIHPVTKDYICSNPTGDGLIPLMFGNLEQGELSLGVGVRTLNDGSMLQVEGNVNPHTDLVHNLGSSNYHWNKIYLTNGLEFNGGPSILLNTDRFNANRSIATTNALISNTLSVATTSLLTGGVVMGSTLSVTGEADFDSNVNLDANLLVKKHNTFTLGSPSKRFGNSFFSNVYAKYVQSDVFEAQRQVHFSNKTLRLGSSSDIYSVDGGGPDGLFDYFDPADTISAQPYLNDNSLEDAGLIIHSTTLDPTDSAKYEFVFKPFGTLANARSSAYFYSRNTWYSNISLTLAPTAYLNTQHVYGQENLCIGTFSSVTNTDPRIKFTDNKTIDIGFEDSANYSSIGDVNFTAESEELDRFDINIMSNQDSVNLFHRYRVNVSTSANHGFDVGYISDSRLPEPSYFNEQVGQSPKRFVIRGFNGQDYASNALTLMQGDSDGGVGISNFAYADNMLPDTIFNVRSTGNAVARVTAETNGSVKSSLELLTRENCLEYGTTLSYGNNTELFEIETLSNGNKATTLRLDNDGHVCIQPSGFTHGSQNKFMLTLGSPQYTQGTLGLFNCSGESIPPSSGYGVLFVKEKPLEDQVHDLKFMDGSGNVFNVPLTASASSDTIFDRSVYATTTGNTYAGLGTPPTIDTLDNTNISKITTYGFRAFRNLIDGNDSVAIGYRAGENLANGDNNVLIGCGTVVDIEGGSNNFIIGPNVNARTGTQSNIFDLNGRIVCNDTSASSAEYFIDGYLNLNNYTRIISNKLMYSGSQGFSIGRGFEINGVMQSTNTLIVNEDGSTFNSNLRLATHAGTSASAKLIFNDNTELSSSSFLNTISTNTSNIASATSDIQQNADDIVETNKKIDAQTVEGFVYGGTLTPPAHPTSPTTFRIIQYKEMNGTWQEVPADPDNDPPRFIDVKNRDPGLALNKGEYVVAQRIGSEYRVVWVSNYRLPTSEL
tara:strand:- start:492 stop:3833 length:3342 start_codon:yes stop_codon:yes gene_type:complete